MTAGEAFYTVRQRARHAAENHRRRACHCSHLCVGARCGRTGEERLRRAYLGEAFWQIGQKARSPYREWLIGLCSQMEKEQSGTFASMWEEGTKAGLKASGLPEGEILRLAAFGNQLGIADVEMQVKTLDLYLEELRISMEEMREEMRTKIRLCHCLGVMSGIFITVLLI